jgi:hypothetical protein
MAKVNPFAKKDAKADPAAAKKANPFAKKGAKVPAKKGAVPAKKK